MSEIIASTYELIEKIGSGGGGNVYLANHLRLNKKVVLKADKRKISSNPELLRREVDVLKNLNHTYIPKVYDFFIENDTLYTVMDYIDGISFDKPLKEGRSFSQTDVIKWAKQLLQALDYLHSPIHGDPPKGYVHSDIKPANIMLNRYGDICLIDFNIALALGEENVIGCSAGYASPEHYGLDYSSNLGTKKSTNIDLKSDETVIMSDASSKLTVSSVKKVIPDARSDIYSLGATLYHLLSGIRPANSAVQVVPLSEKKFSPQIVKIITKSMQPNPDLRYQSAKEMLYDLNHLYENDPRYKKKKRSLKIACACFGTLLAAGVFMSFTGLKRMQSTEEALKLAEYSSNMVAEGNKILAVDYAIQALPQKTNLFTPGPTAQAECALANALGVYDLSDSFKSSYTVELPSAPLNIALAPDGKTFVCVCASKTLVIDTSNGNTKKTFNTNNSALSEVKYIDNDKIVYSSEGVLKVYDISQDKELWKGEAATAMSVSEDRKTIAALYKDNDYAVIYDASTGKVNTKVSFGGKKQFVAYNDSFLNPQVNLFSLNNDGTLLAVSFENGVVSVYDANTGEEKFYFDENQYTQFEGGFYQNYLAFAASGSNGAEFITADLNSGTVGKMESPDSISSFVDSSGVYLKTNNIFVRINPATGEQTPMANTLEKILSYKADNSYAVISTRDGVKFYNKDAMEISSFDNIDNKSTYDFLELANNIAVIGSQNSSLLRVLKYESFSDKEVFSYDPSYIHDEARISADGKTVTLFRYDEFSIYDINGQLIKTVKIPESDKVRDQQFIRNGDSSELQVIYYSGKVDVYSAADGSLIREEEGEPLSKDIEDIFLTDKLKIVSPLHGAPQVYDIGSEKLVKELTEDAYLTYITQVDEYIIAQYVKSNDDFYGVLMNSECENLAVLPRLCDVYNNTLYFDYKTGNMRETRIYKLNELINLAQKQ